MIRLPPQTRVKGVGRQQHDFFQILIYSDYVTIITVASGCFVFRYVIMYILCIVYYVFAYLIIFEFYIHKLFNIYILHYS